jgi:peroxiredoxin Q/BCP
MLRKRWIAAGCAVALAGLLALTKSAAAAAGDGAGWKCGAELYAALAGEQAGLAERLQGQVGGAVLLSQGPDQGCTIEAHNFQRDLPKYDALNAVVLGVSAGYGG